MRPLLHLLVIALCFSFLMGSAPLSLLEKIKLKGVLTVVTRNSPSTYYEDRSGPTGFEYELAKAFAQSLNVELQIKIADNFDDLYRHLHNNNAHLAAASITETPTRLALLSFSQPYKTVQEFVVYRRGALTAQSPADLNGARIMVAKDSGHSERLKSWQQEFPELSWNESADTETIDLLQMLANGHIDFTLIDSNEFNLLQAYFPSLSIAFDTDTELTVAWGFAKQHDQSLETAVNTFLNNLENTPFLASLSERFYGHLETLDYVGAQYFLRQTSAKLGRYKETFQEAAKKHQFDWRLLAAASYQESHWNPLAKSFTGVRGMMMLTRNTAKELGVTNRLDAEQSILGGSLYLSRLRDRLPEITEPDKTWLMLAAYNVGYGHLLDARRLTARLGGNPDLWLDVKETLPLLSQKRFYKETRYGYARGQEAVDYVQNIRRYYDVLVWNDERPENIRENTEMLVSASTNIPPLL